MAEIVACANQKGGVGKTTTVVNLAAYLALGGRRVLVLDLDPQGNATSGLGIDRNAAATSLYDGLIEGVPLAELVTRTAMPGLDLIPASRALAGVEVELVPLDQRERRLARALASVAGGYDHVLLDCPPSLGLLTVNALTAADGVIVPLECEYFALRGVALLKTTIDKVRQRLNPRLRIDGVLGTMYDARTLHAREVMERLVQAWGEDVFHTVIRRTVKFSDSTVAGEPITSYASASAGATAYRTLAKEVLARCHDV